MPFPSTAPQRNLSAALRQLADLAEIGADKQWHFGSTYRLVLSEGRWFRPPVSGAPLPEARRACFAAAAKLAQRSDLTYVEGYVLIAFGSEALPIEHAWCSTSAGDVVDPALGAGPGLAYLGVPLTEDFHRLVTTRANCVAVIHAREQDRHRLLIDGLPQEAIVDVGLVQSELSSESRL